MARNFFGKGWKYPVEVARTGGIAMSEHEEAIRQSILIVLGTAPGERVMRPHFGCEIHELVYAPNNVNTAGLAAHYCIDALTKWEPRIDDVEAEAEPSPDDPNQLNLYIKYKVRATNNSRNLVYPFYLRRSDDK
ncbi:MAG TPA: GPW/gp25 family protein [Polyangia bacterium]|nr:GPW/gp25 family protein [Polyangia bacterium]